MRRFDTKMFSLFAIGFILVVVSWFSYRSLEDFSHNTVRNQEDSVEDAIKKAAVQCYALEGAYPPNIDYLEEHYGVVLDKDAYVYYYDAFSSNIMPDIMVRSLLIDDSERLEHLDTPLQEEALDEE